MRRGGVEAQSTSCPRSVIAFTQLAARAPPCVSQPPPPPLHGQHQHRVPHRHPHPTPPNPNHLHNQQDIGANSIKAAREMLYSGAMRMEARTNAAQAEGNVHDMLAYEKRPW